MDLLSKERLIIPKAMRQQMKVELHSSHIGINGCLRRAIECMFWPGISAEVKIKGDPGES